MAPKFADITGLVLAGGRGARMGGADKGWVDYERRPLIEHVIERFAPQVGSLVISANRNVERYRALHGVGDVVTDDNDQFDGPLAGVLAGLASARTDWLAIVPCDAPRLPLDLVGRLAAALDTADNAACARVEGQLQPVFALIARTLLPHLQRFYRDGGRSLQRGLDVCRLVAVDFEDARPFLNVNAIAADRHGL